MGTSSDQKREKISENREIEKTPRNLLFRKKFACPMSYFERPANLMSKEVRPAYWMSNIEIPPPDPRDTSIDTTTKTD